MSDQPTLYEYAVVHDPEGEPSALVVAPTSVLATDEAQVRIVAARSIPKELADDLDHVRVLVRPF